MRCSQCGRDVAENVSFCPHCGERLSGATVGRPEAAGGENTASPSAATERVGRDPTRFGTTAPPEEELWNGTFSPKAMIGEFVAADVVTLLAIVGALLWWNSRAGWWATIIFLFVLWAGLGLLLAYRLLSVRYRLTRYRFFHERGILSRVSDRIETIDIDDVTVHQGLIERLMSVGTIIVVSSDRTHPNLHLRGIDNAREVADLIDSTRRAERQRRGLHIEAI